MIVLGVNWQNLWWMYTFVHSRVAWLGGWGLAGVWLMLHARPAHHQPWAAGFFYLKLQADG